MEMKELELDYSLKGLSKYHLYIAHSLGDGHTAEKLAEGLKKHKIKCFLRHEKGQEAGDQLIKGRIQSGVLCSQKCLVLLTKDYLEDDWHNIEIEEVATKGHRFSSDCVMIAQIGTEQSRVDVPETLKGFGTFLYDESNLPENFLKSLAQKIVKESLGVLSVLPRENMGHGSALGYYYGYLQLVLPEFNKRLEEQLFLKHPEMVGKTIKKMLIIIPKSCLCPPELKEPGKIEFYDFITRMASRAGNVMRDYKSSVYKLTDIQTKVDYFFVAELATPLLTMFESFVSGLANMTRDQLYLQREVFAYTLDQILSHPKNRLCNGQFKILWWDDEEGLDGKKVNPFYDFLLPVLRSELEYENSRPRGKLQTDDESFGAPDPNASENLAVSSNTSNTFKPFESDFGNNPHDYYDILNFDYYRFEHNPRGKCIIINIANFHKSESVTANQLSTRRGADQDAIHMRELFEYLKFEVEVHQDVNRINFEQILLTANHVDHSRYDAFVCVIMTHGKLGVVFSSDGKEIRVLDIVDFFSDKLCPSLKGKPKMFFIQACQRGLTGNENTGNNMQADRSAQDAGATKNSTRETDEGGDNLPMKNLKITNQEGAGDTGLKTDAVPDFRDEPMIEIYSSHQVNRHNQSQATEASNETANSENQAVQSCINSGVAPVVDNVPENGLPSIDSNAAPTLSPSLAGSAEQKASLVPGAPDFLMSYSTLPGSISYRDTVAGSLYIGALAKHLKQNIEIDRALKSVTAEVKQKLIEKGEFDRTVYQDQLPFHLTTGMSKLLYLAQKTANV